MKLLAKNRRWAKVRVHFWLFVDPEVLEHFFGLAGEGRFGDIRRAEGHSRDRQGKPLSFVYEGGRLEVERHAGPAAAEAGWMELAGDMTSEDLIQMRNHTVCHLRAFFKDSADTLRSPAGG